MKLIIAAFLVAFAAAALRERNELRDSLSPVDLTPFKTGQEYRYRFDSQIASGIAEISEQKALTRLQCLASFNFNTDRMVTLRLENIRMGTANRMVSEPNRIQPMGLVEETKIESEQLRKLGLPLQFNYVDGLIERITFHPEDEVWSKNIKRSVLNLLQVNLKAKNLPEEQRDFESEEERRSDSLTRRMYTVPETTLEGECPTTYVVNKLDSRRATDVDFFNVTKTINFKECERLSDVYYGPQAEKRVTEETDDQQKLRRSTMLRHFIVGTTEKFAIKKSESISQYSFKTLNAETETPMVSIVVCELTCIEVKKSTHETLRMQPESREESLLYSTDFDRDIKRFYMYGDEEYPENTPFSKILDKVTLVKNVLRKVLNSMNNKDIGLEAESTVQLPRLVTLLRTCSVKDLKNIIDSVDTKGKEILLDALAIAATRNTMHVLAEKIMKREISTPKAIQSLKAISGVPAPSDKQVEILIRLCKSDVVKGSESLRQSCWLTVGSLMGEFCETTEQNNYIIHKKVNTEVCPRHVTDKFLQPLMEEFRRVDTRYEKILVLKALGNAGIEPMVPELEKVIYDEREDPIVRVQAIDSLRRLREEIPERIQRILMPIFKNQRESTEVRLQALALVMQTLPENSILDQIAFVLIRERSKNVKSFVYDIMKAYSQSPIVEEQKLAGHLKAVIKLAGIDEVEEEKMRSSRAHRFPIYSNQQEEGIFLNWESMFSSDNAFPKKVSAGMDSFLNGIFDKSTLELNFMQEDLDRWYEKFVNKMSDSYEGSNTRRSASVRRGQQELRSIFNNLGIKARSEYSPREDRRTNAPFGVLSLRFRDTDYVVLPLEEQFMPEVVRKLVIESEKPRARDLEQIWKLLSQPSRVNTAWNLYERVIKVPSSAGIPLRLIQSTPVLGYVESDIKFNQGRVQIKLQPSMSASYIKKIEAWCPVVNSGVENVMSVELNLPVEGEIYTEDGKAKIIVKPPTSDKRMVGFHSLPVTFTRKYERTGVHGEMEVKTIRNELLESRMINLEEVYGEEKFALPTHIKGHIHKPTQNSYVSLVDALMTSENLVHIEFKPSPESPQQLMLTLDAESFKESNSKLRPQFTRFYSKFNEEMEKHHKFSEIDNENDEEKLNKYLEKFEPRQIYEHQIRAELKSIGGRRPKSAELSLKASCDDKFGYCQTEMEIRRDPILEGENEDWKLKSKVQALLPEYSHDLEQHQTDKTKKYQKFVCSVDSKWGSREEQYVNVRINGEQAKTQEWLDTEETETKRDREFPEKTAFLNKYDISIDYQLQSASKNFFSNWFGMYKAYNFWNTKTHVQDSKEKQLVTALVVIDPISRQHLNVTINTPTERVKIHTVEMPTKVSPFPLIRRPMPSIGSVNELLTSVVVKKETQKECIVDGNQVHTFDEVTFKAPITKCYTVLAKDCSSSSPRFAVLLKKTDSDKKMLKIAKDGEMFEIESDGDNFKYRLNEEDKKERDMEDYGFTTRDNMMTYVSNELTVRFNGRKVWVKIDQLYKNSQCGLCGHYDDQEEGEFRMNDNKMTSDLREFHRSYTLKDGRCDSDFDETLRSERFETIRSEEFFSSESDENDDEKPFQKTYIMEYGSSKICFSKKPVPTCADDSYAVEKKEMKVQFGCLDRSSSEARSLLRRLKKERVVEEIRDLANSFVEQIRVPIKCAEY